MPRLKLVAGAGFEPVRLTAYETVEPPLLHSRKRIIVGGYRGTRTRSRLFTRQLLFYPFELVFSQGSIDGNLSEPRTVVSG